MRILRSGPVVALCCFAALGANEQEVGEFSIRPVLPLTAPQLTELRRIVAADDEAAALARAAITASEPWLDATPQPLARLHYEGLVNTDPKRIATVARLREMDGVAALVRRWQLRGDAQSAAALLRFVDAWSSTYVPTGNDVNENKFVPLYVAWHALRAEAPAALRERVDAWIDRLAKHHVKAVTRSRRFNNRYTKHVRMVALFGLIRSREDWLALARKGVERFVGGSLRPDGTSYDLEQRDTLTYHCSALKPPLELAMLLGAAGRDLYTWQSSDGASLRKSVEYVVPYATGEKTHREWVHSKVDLDRRRAEAGLEKYRKGRLFDPKDARGLMEVASCFDPELLPLAVALGDGEAERYPAWRNLISAAIAGAAD